MTSECSLCGKNYKNLLLHQVKTHETIEITREWDAEQEYYDFHIKYHFGTNYVVMEEEHTMDGGDRTGYVFAFPEGTNPRYGGLYLDMPDTVARTEGGEGKIEVYYLTKTQVWALGLDHDKLTKVRTDRVKITL